MTRSTNDPWSFTPKNNFHSSGLSLMFAERPISRELNNASAVRCTHVAAATARAQYEQVFYVTDRIDASASNVLLGMHSDLIIGVLDQGDEYDPAISRINFNTYCDTEAFLSFDNRASVLIIIDNLLERLRDVRPLLGTVRRILRCDPRNRLIIRSAERNDEAQPPLDCFRQWTSREFTLALETAGFYVHSSNSSDEEGTSGSTLIAELSCNEAFYDAFLKRHGMPSLCDHIVFTTEHSDLSSTGGIGTYHKNVEIACGLRRLVLFIGTMGLNHTWRRQLAQIGAIHVCVAAGRTPEALCDLESSHDIDEILDALLNVCFFYDSARLVEYQDYLGVGVRIAQAARAYMLPSNLKTMVVAHGNLFYLDYAANKFSDANRLEQDAKERLSIELADTVLFPTAYMKQLYIDQCGYNLENITVQAIPVPLAQSASKIECDSIDTLIFFGKETEQKGYYDFCNAVTGLSSAEHGDGLFSHIKRVILIGARTAPEELSNVRGIEIQAGVFTRSDALKKLYAERKRSLVVLPYKGDNHPLSFFEVVASRSQILAYRAGGMPELVSEAVRDRIFCAPDLESLMKGILASMQLSVGERRALINDVMGDVLCRYTEINQAYRLTINGLKSASPRVCPDAPHNAVSIAVSNYGGNARYINDLVTGVLNSSIRANSITVVDDGSPDDTKYVLKEALADVTSIRCRLVASARNRGLPAARNLALACTDTAYVCIHDNDNIILNEFLEQAIRILESNPAVCGVTGWSRYFEDGADWRMHPKHDGYRPLGSDLGLGLRRNCFGDALAVFRTSVLREVGGWNDASRAMWEDWEFYARLTALGYRVWVIPKEVFLYRVRPGSMLRQYDPFDALLRLKNVFPHIPNNMRTNLLRAIVAPPTMCSHESGAHDDALKLARKNRRLRRQRQALTASLFISFILLIVVVSLDFVGWI